MFKLVLVALKYVLKKENVILTISIATLVKIIFANSAEKLVLDMTNRISTSFQTTFVKLFSLIKL